jgi:hypothetical protein
MPVAAAKRRICHRGSFNTNGIIADVARVFAIALECGSLLPLFPHGGTSLLAVRRSAVKREQARWRKAAARQLTGRTPERAGG